MDVTSDLARELSREGHKVDEQQKWLEEAVRDLDMWLTELARHNFPKEGEHRSFQEITRPV